MILVWRGYGALVALIAVAAFFLAGAINAGAHLQPPYSGMVLGSCAVFAGAGVWVFAMWMEGRPGRTYIDKASGREFTVGQDAGSLFFVPTKYWAFIIPGLWMLATLFDMLHVRA